MTPTKRRGGRRRITRLTDPLTYPHEYAALVVVRQYFGVSQRILNRWHENGDLVIRDLAGVRKVKMSDLVAFEARNPHAGRST